MLLPTTLSVIKDSAFLKCRKLKYIRIPDNVKVIEKWAFHGCSGLQVELRHDPEVLGEWIFNKNGTIVRCRKGSRVDAYCKEYDLVREYIG